MSSDEKWKEYDYVFRLEQELNKTRLTVFAAFPSVSVSAKDRFVIDAQ